MDFLDTLDLSYMEKKSSRVRSWYFYEQYKSLEENQTYAAHKLKARSYQDKLLCREISERRARRRLYEQSSFSECDRHAYNPLKTARIRSPSSSTDNFYESFSEFRERESNNSGRNFPTCVINYEQDEIVLDDWSSKDSAVKSEQDRSFARSEDESQLSTATSVMEIKEHNDNMDSVFKEELDRDRDIAENLAQETEPNEQQMSNDFNKFYVDDKLSDTISLDSYGKLKLLKNGKHVRCDNSVFAVWARLVSFAYQLVQLNHGNCYYDYSSQILTAVLACDVVLKGVSKVCNILQPYTSPVKYASTDNGDDSYCRTRSTKKYKNKKQISLNNKRFTKNNFGIKITKLPSLRKLDQRYKNINKPNNSLRVRSRKKFGGLGDPVDCACNDKLCKLTRDSSSDISDGGWSQVLCHDVCSDCDCGKVINPMVKLNKYINRQQELWHDLSKRI